MEHKCNGCRYKGEHQEMMFRPFGVCLRERDLIQAEKNYNADICPYKDMRNEPGELKPCPFCGGIPKYYQYGINWCVECRSKKCWIVPETGICPSKEEAANKWNTRTPKERSVDHKT